VVALAVVPGVPVAEEQAVEDLRLDLALPRELVAGRGLLELLARRRVGLDGEAQEQALAVGEDLQVLDVEREARELRRLAALERHAPDLRGAAARREEHERAAVGQPARARVVRLVRGQPAQARAVGADEPDVEAPAVRGDVGRALFEEQRAAVGRDLPTREALHRQHVVDREGMADGALRRDEEQQVDQGGPPVGPGG
jgi:hypothetical protein